jgi:molybdopterin-guanine dinucleotide biosynthesis protein A
LLVGGASSRFGSPKELLTPGALRLLADASRDAATAQHGPLPCAVARRTLPAFETGERRLRAVLDGLDTVRIELEEKLLANVNEPGDLHKIATSEDNRTRGEA